MYRHSTDVVAEDLRPLTDDLSADGRLLPDDERAVPDPTAPGRSEHLNFDRILRRCGYAWMAFLATAGDGVFGTAVIVPRLEVDYLAEVRSGTLDVDVSVLDVGRSSFRLLLAVSQAGIAAANVQVVLVVFDYADGRPVPLSAEQRAFLST